MRFVLLGLLLSSLGASAQTVPVTFRVQMDVWAERGDFDPTAQFVDVAGSFNGWGATPRVLTDADGDLTYELTVPGFTPGATVAYKHRIDGQWDGTEEFPGGGPNRSYTVQPTGNVVTVWYNDEAPATGPPMAAFSGSRVVADGGVGTFLDRSSGAVTSRAWTFEGGDPATSTDAAPSVRYAALGTYDVTLVVAGPEGADTLTVEDFVEVRERQAGEARWWNDAVFYEVFVRSFADSDGDGIGDFDGLTARLDYLNDGDPATDTDLGVTGLWLMPIHDSPSYHGYDVVDYRSVHPDYGTLDDVRAFLDAAHARGIRVVIDYMMNHTARTHPWFQASAANDPIYRDFYRWAPSPQNASGPWGQTVWHSGARGYYYGLFWSGMPDLNYETPAVRDSMTATADFWLEDVGVDGFRLDAAKYLVEDGAVLENTPETLAFWRDFNQHLATVADDPFTVCEAWSTTDAVVPYLLEGEMGACFEFDLAGRILQAVRTGVAAPLVAKVEEVDSVYPPFGVATFLTNHDQDRVMEELGLDVARGRAAAALYLTLPGVPFVYYGEEIGMLGQEPDEFIRRPMQWSDAPGAGFTTGTPWIALNSNYQAWNVAGQTGDPASLLSAYRRLIAARNGSAALRRGRYYGVPATDGGVVAFLREHEGERVLVAINVAGEAASGVTLSLPPGLVGAGTYTAESLIGDADESLTVSASGQVAGVALEPLGVRVLRIPLTVGTDGGAGGAPSLELDVPFPNPASGHAQVVYRVGQPGMVRLDVFDALGRRVLTLAEGDAAAGTHTAAFDASALPSGVYSLRLTQGERGAVRRLVVAR